MCDKVVYNLLGKYRFVGNDGNGCGVITKWILIIYWNLKYWWLVNICIGTAAINPINR